MSNGYRTLFLAVTVAGTLWGQPVERPSMFAGTHFFVAFMQNEIERGSSLRLQLSIVARTPTTVWLQLPTEAHPRQYRLAAGEQRWIAVPQELEVRTVERPLRSAVEVRSDAPVVVYAFNSQTTTTDAYTALPIVNWGTEYVVASLPNDAYTPRPGDTSANRRRDLTLRRSQWMVIAAYDSTVVTFVPRVRTSTGKAADIPHSVVLNRGECYLVQSDSTPKGSGDMTGTFIRSSKPIGVLSGHVRVSLPFNLPTEVDTKDHLVEMLPPIPTLGRRYITVPFAVGTGDWFRAIAIAPQTRLRLTRASTGTVIETVLQRPGDVADFPAEASVGLWEADQPFLLVQLMYSAVVGGPQALTDPYASFDPAMVFVPPIEQYVQHAHCFVPDTTLSGLNQFKRHWINLILSDEAVSELTLNNVPLTTLAPEVSSQRLPWTVDGKQYYWARLRVAPGRIYELRSPRGVFAGIVYGTGYVDSYALLLGSGLLPQQRVDDEPPELTAHADTCGRVTLRGSDTPAGIAWLLPIPDSTWNYTWEYEQPVASEATLFARPQDLSAEGRLYVEIRDNAGNRQWYSYAYQPPRLQWNPPQADFSNAPAHLTTCKEVQAVNPGRDTLRLWDYRFRDRRIATQPQLPAVVPPQDSISIRICFQPSGNLAPLNDTLYVTASCGVVFALPLRGTVDSLGLSARGCSFGDVLVGEERACLTQWINIGTRPLTVTAARIVGGGLAFTLDTSGLFPRTLSPGDTLRLRVLFRPQQPGVVSDDIELTTLPPIPVRARIDGRGIAPLIPNVSLDWGRRRIGKRFDSTVAIINLGDSPTQLYLISDSGDTELGCNIAAVLTLDVGDTLLFPVWFAPQQAQRYLRSLTLQSSWQLHPPITIRLTGEGTAPELSPRVVEFDTLPLGGFQDTLAVLFTTAGNEAVRVDSLWIEGPDAAAFSFLQLPPVPWEVMPGGLFQVSLRFAPLRVGEHRAWIAISHNARPPAPWDTVHVLLRGFGLPPPDTATPRWSVRVFPPEATAACSKLPVRLCLWNWGSTTIVWDGLSVVGGTLLDATPPPPKSIVPGDSLCLVALLDGFPSGSVAIRIRASLRSEHLYQDTLRVKRFIWEDTLRLHLWPQPWTIDWMDSLSLQPGEQGLVSLEGSLPVLGSHTPSGTICLTLPPEVWYVRTAEAVYELLDGRGGRVSGIESSYELPQGFCFRVAPVHLQVPSRTRWRLLLPVEAYLGKEQQYAVLAVVVPDSGACFVGDTLRVAFRLSIPCSPYLYSVRLQEAPEVRLLRVFPTPAADAFAAAFWCSAPTTAQLRLLNLHGQPLKEWPISLQQGANLRKFEIATLPAGCYYLQLIAGTTRQHHVLVIQR
ncbi:MAG: choice-of-anchor D domain-containing protein [Candidatus Kapabacteria bacterium]|nr:choice-of-anchor D domain-containing protein [Candidatus Kapabacteria bacterium]MDW8011607.1 choice-of-anchor D domain-containing protein [Bacteroidota bacterium]